MIAAPLHDTAAHGEAVALDALAAADEDTLAVFAVNRHPAEDLALTVEMRALPGYRLVERTVLANPDIHATNTAAPDRIRPRAAPLTAVADGRLTAALPSVSWNVLRLAATR